MRQKEDPWNSIMAGAATGGTLAARAGYKAIARSAAIGGVLLALIEGLGVAMNNMLSAPAGGFDDGLDGAGSMGIAPPLSPPMELSDSGVDATLDSDFHTGGIAFGESNTSFR